MAELVTELREKAARIALGGPAAAREKHVARGKLLPRQRVEALRDPHSAFLEIGQVDAHEDNGEDSPPAGPIAGLGPVHYTPLTAPNQKTGDSRGRVGGV